MRDFAGRTAFITGGASGFGLALAHRLAGLGMRVMLADIDQPALDHAVHTLQATGASADGVFCDVTERESMRHAAARTKAAFGDVHLLCNNAGVLVAGTGDRLAAADWDWIFAVNVMGVVNGLATFLPAMLEHGQPGHVLNTASIAGLKGFPHSGAYCATKAAIVALTEAVRGELDGTPIGVTALCPGFMRTPFFSSGAKRQARFGGPADLWDTVIEETKENLSREMEAGLEPAHIAQLAIEGVRDNMFIVVTHPQDRSVIQARSDGIADAFDWLDETLARMTPGVAASAEPTTARAPSIPEITV